MTGPRSSVSKSVTVRARRPREHLTEAEIEKLMAVAKHSGRYGHRDATAILITVADWADHYSQEANYLRLNGILPPTAQPRRGM